MRRFQIAIPVIIFLIAADLTLIFGYAPVEAAQGLAQKIFYWHVGSAITMQIFFAMAGLFSLFYLVTKKIKFDRWALSFVEVGFLFCTIVLLTGPIWAKPIWGVWWTWEPRLTSTLFIWMIFLGYFILRGSFTDPGKKRTFSAILAIFGCLDIPIIFFSVRLWRGVHPSVLGRSH